MLRSFASPLFTKLCAGAGLALLLAGCGQDSGVAWQCRHRRFGGDRWRDR